jgi:hypothetical protein
MWAKRPSGSSARTFASTPCFAIRQDAVEIVDREIDQEVLGRRCSTRPHRSRVRDRLI